MEYSTSKKRILKNTLMLYFRQILIMIVSLYSVRVVLNVLGTEDYGIYNVVAGVVTMFSFLSSAMAASTQRFYSYSIGQNDNDKLREIFCITIEIYIVLILLVVVFAETIGVWFVKNKLVIPVERMKSALVLYQLSIASFVFGLLAAPFMALIISHENMSVYAYVSIVESFLKLVIVFLLKVFQVDKLVLYGILLCLVNFIITSLYYSYCKLHFKETKFAFLKNKAMFNEIASFSGWCLFGTSAGIVKNQITNILLNLYFGPIVNAARGIALNVNSAITSFASNFNMAVRPQIVKNYSVGNKNETFELVIESTKLSFYLLLLFMIPLYLEMDYVLTIWLKNVPNLTIKLTQLILIEILFDSLSYPMQSLSQASGKMKLYQSVVGSVLLLNLPFAYIVLKLGFDVYAVQFVAIVIGIIALILRIIINKYLTSFSLKTFISKAIIPCFFVFLTSCILPTIVSLKMHKSFIRLILVTMTSTGSLVGAIFLFGLTKDEKCKIYNKVLRRRSV